MYFADKFCSLSLYVQKYFLALLRGGGRSITAMDPPHWFSQQSETYFTHSVILAFMASIDSRPSPCLTWPDLTWPSHWTQCCLAAPLPDCIIYISARYNIQVRVKFHWVRILYSELWRVCLLYLLITCFCAESMLLGLLQPDSIKDAVTHAFTASLGSNICSFGLRRSRAWVQIAAATLAGNSFRQTVHTHRACVH